MLLIFTNGEKKKMCILMFQRNLIQIAPEGRGRGGRAVVNKQNWSVGRGLCAVCVSVTDRQFMFYISIKGTVLCVRVIYPSKLIQCESQSFGDIGFLSNTTDQTLRLTLWWTVPLNSSSLFTVKRSIAPHFISTFFCGIFLFFVD